MPELSGFNALITYDRTGLNISTYPHDIPLDAESIIIDRTTISQIDFIEIFSNLTSYRLSDNKISVFPNLSNVSNSIVVLTVSMTNIATIPVDAMATMPLLQKLDISQNKISELPDLTTVFPVLQSLSAYSNVLSRMGRTTAKSLTLDYNKMTELPDVNNVWDTFSYLSVSGNNISSIPSGDIPRLPKCRNFNIRSNKLTTFPDVSNMTDLYSLDLSSNRINSMSGVPRMSSLVVLTMDDNELTTFPNLTNIKNRLSILFIFDNEIVVFPDELMAPLTSLWYFKIGRKSRQPIYLPNFCMMNHTNSPLSLTIVYSSINCDQNAIFAQMAERVGMLDVTSPPSCISPNNVIGRKFNNLTADQLWPRQSASLKQDNNERFHGAADCTDSCRSRRGTCQTKETLQS
ncbi:hypothetical protein LSH36_923g01057 [Paralvinella palmiformis]|uniref:Uncharacterized protein n=1 Tax=Paralvinella palmiformis TaxID=53620 RepID=A0AAD9MRE1_9ANNE|nr:hypothetical protein LSH36_923g01057 [Paralvinella palmiformis]